MDELTGTFQGHPEYLCDGKKWLPSFLSSNGGAHGTCRHRHKNTRPSEGYGSGD